MKRNLDTIKIGSDFILILTHANAHIWYDAIKNMVNISAPENLAIPLRHIRKELVIFHIGNLSCRHRWK